MDELFDFQKLARKYKERVAIIDNKHTYTYQNLYDSAQNICDTNGIKMPYVVLIIKETRVFISEFIAVHLAGAIPIILTEQDLPNVPWLLKPLAGQWQWLTEFVDGVKNNQLRTGILFLGKTSGTTGNAKIYQRDWHSWRIDFERCFEVFEMNNDEIVMTTSSMATSLGLHTMLLSLYFGKSFYCFERYQPMHPLKSTIVYTVPTYLGLKDTNWAYNPNIRGIVSCGGELQNKLVKQWQTNHIKHALYELYGSSETSLVSWQKITQDKKPNDVGELFPAVTLEVNQHRRLIVSSPYLFCGYLGCNDHPITQVMTDDVGYYQDNHLYVLGRKSDVIKHGGNKIYPSEIEHVLTHLTKSVVVFGVPDLVYGENIVAMVVTDETEPTLKSHVANYLPKYKVPTRYIFVDEIPKTPQQKISRALLTTDFMKGRWS